MQDLYSTTETRDISHPDTNLPLRYVVQDLYSTETQVLNHPDPNLPLRFVMQDLYSTEILDLNHPDPNLPLRYVVQDLYSTETQAREHVLCTVGHADYTAPTRQHELYELVQAKPPQISSATNAACISNSNVTYLVSC